MRMDDVAGSHRRGAHLLSQAHSHADRRYFTEGFYGAQKKEQKPETSTQRAH